MVCLRHPSSDVGSVLTLELVPSVGQVIWRDKEREFVVAEFSLSNRGLSAEEEESVFRALDIRVTGQE